MRARAVVNATGPWADGLPHSRVKLRLTKGIHLVVERARLPVTETVVMTEGKRILFAIPWGERTILGTTDTDYDGPLDDVRADAADIGYVLQVTNQFFPGGQAGRGGRHQRLGGSAAVGRRPERQAVGHIARARDPQSGAGLVGCGGGQAHHLSLDGRADGGPDR